MFKNFTKRDTLGTALILLIGLCSLGAWQFFVFAMTHFGVSDIWWLVFWFILLTIFFFLGTIIWSTTLSRIIGAILVSLPGFLLIQAWEYIVAGIVSALCIYVSSASIARERDERIRFHFFKSVQTSSFLFFMGLSLLISSGYYVSLKDASWEELVPRFRIGEGGTRAIFKVAGMVNPSFAKLSEGNMTIDEFLLNLEQNKQESDVTMLQTSMTEQDILNAYREMSQSSSGRESTLPFDIQSIQTAQEVFLDGGRKQIASLVGRSVTGDEKISDVLSSALQNKLVTFLGGEKVTGHISSPAIPFFLSLLVFLTLLSLSSIVAPLCILIAHGFFSLFLWAGWLSIGKVSVEQERLAE